MEIEVPGSDAILIYQPKHATTFRLIRQGGHASREQRWRQMGRGGVTSRGLRALRVVLEQRRDEGRGGAKERHAGGDEGSRAVQSVTRASHGPYAVHLLPGSPPRPEVSSPTRVSGTPVWGCDGGG